MEYELTIDNAHPVQLDEQDQAIVRHHIAEVWSKGRSERGKYEADWQACSNAYDCIPEIFEESDMDWQSNHVLPWAYDAVESWCAYMHSAMIPRNDKVFSISGRTEEDNPGAETMEKYLEYRFERNKFPELFMKALRYLARKNHLCLKVYWREERKVGYEWEPVYEADPMTGSPTLTSYRTVSKENTVYNNPWFEIVELENFSFWPIHGDINKTTRVHQTYKYYEELMALPDGSNTPYFNLDLINNEETVDTYDSSVVGIGTRKELKRGHNVKEAWIHRLQVGTNEDGSPRIFRNYIATVVDDKILIRFQPNKMEMGNSPFIFTSLMPDGECKYGYGLLSKGNQLLRAANFLFNQRLNEIKITMYQPHKYYDDGVFNPYNLIQRPGALIEFADRESVQSNMMPVSQDLAHLQLAYSEVEALRNEYDEVTVPKVIRGMVDQREVTATETSFVQNNSSGKMNMHAFDINENVLNPLVEMIYALVYQRMNMDPQIKEEIARLTVDATEVIPSQSGGPPVITQKDPNQLVSELPKFLPLPEVDIKVVGYQNTQRKQQTLAALSQTIPQLAQSPAAPYLKWYGLAQTTFRLADLDKSELLVDDDERKQIDQQQQQQAQAHQQMQIQAEQQKLQIEMMREQNKAEAERMANDLKALEIELKYGLELEKLASSVQQADQQLQQAEQAINPQEPNQPEQVA